MMTKELIMIFRILFFSIMIKINMNNVNTLIRLQHIADIRNSLNNH